MSKGWVSSRDLEAILDECLAQPNQEGSTTAYLARHPAAAAQIESLLRTAHQCESLRETQGPSPAGLQAGRQKLLSEAARRREALQAPRKQPLSLWPSLTFVLRRGALILLLAGALLSVALGKSTLAASAKSLPGDPLYSVKRITEDLQLALTFDRQARFELQQTLDERRRQEALAIAGSQRVAELSFRGRVESTSGAHWQIAGIPIIISNDTIVDAGVDIGTWVRAQVHSLSDGTLSATRISVEPEPVVPTETATAIPTVTQTILPTPSELPTSGVIASTSLPVPLASPTPTASPTPPIPPGSATPSITPLPTPTSVPPTATPVRQVRVKLRGRIESIAGNAWVVNGQTVHMDAATHVNEQAQPAGIGVLVTVLALQREDGTLFATDIITEATPPTPEPLFEFQGLIESLAQSQWVVAGHACAITSDTVIVGQPEIGLLAEVKALRQIDGSLRALHIEVQPPSDWVQFEGAIETIGADAWVVEGTTVRLDRDTSIVGTPEVGARVEIQGLLLGDGAVLARRIVVAFVPTPTAAPVQAPQGHGTPVPSPTPTIPQVTEEPVSGTPTSCPDITVEPSVAPLPITEEVPLD